MRKMEKGTVGGLLVAATAIALGFSLEGGRMGQVLQPTAAVIVLGGTLGAVLVQFPLSVVRQAFAKLRDAFQPSSLEGRARMEQIMRFAMQARRNGMLSLDPELKKIDDPFFKKALMLAIDGIHARELREIMELELMRMEEEEERPARVWEAAGGFAPTVGILGAVLGLIQVMQQLDNIGDVGRGIAVAFVATLYGVGLANLLFLPLAGKLRIRAREAQMVRETTLEGVVAMVEGVSPRALREKLGAQAGERAPIQVAQMVAR
jgi:chemotaxis protein MotA